MNVVAEASEVHVAAEIASVVRVAATAENAATKPQPTAKAAGAVNAAIAAAKAAVVSARTSLKRQAPAKSTRHDQTSAVRNQKGVVRVVNRGVNRAVNRAVMADVVHATRVLQARKKPATAMPHRNSKVLLTRCQAQKLPPTATAAKTVRPAKAAAAAAVAVVAATVMSRALVKQTLKRRARSMAR